MIDTKYIDKWWIFTPDIIGIIASFLHCKDAINLCYLNKQFYALFLIPVIRNSHVSINIDTIRNSPTTNLFNMLSTMNLHINGMRSIREPIFLYIEKLFNGTNNPNAWKNLRYISFGKSFNRKIDILPPSLCVLAFHPKSIFNQKITKLSCTNLKCIYFGKFFNQKIDFLPDSVEIIHFSDSSKFDKPIRNVPNSLKEIYFGQWFNHDISAIWMAKSLNKLQFSVRSIFMHPIIPSYSLKILNLGMYFNRALDLYESNLISLKFHKLSHYNSVLSIPYSLVILIIGEKFDQELHVGSNTNLNRIQFYAKARFNQTLNIPYSCKSLIIGRHFNSGLIGGSGLEVLKFSKYSKFDKPLDRLEKNKLLIIYGLDNYRQ